MEVTLRGWGSQSKATPHNSRPEKESLWQRIFIGKLASPAEHVLRCPFRRWVPLETQNLNQRNPPMFKHADPKKTSGLRHTSMGRTKSNMFFAANLPPTPCPPEAIEAIEAIGVGLGLRELRLAGGLGLELLGLELLLGALLLRASETKTHGGRAFSSARIEWGGEVAWGGRLGGLGVWDFGV